VVSRRLAQPTTRCPGATSPPSCWPSLPGLPPGRTTGCHPTPHLRVPSLPPLGSAILKPAGVRAASARNWFCPSLGLAQCRKPTGDLAIIRIHYRMVPVVTEYFI
jgi:hypothetical protein